MTDDNFRSKNHLPTQRFYYGTRAPLHSGDVIGPQDTRNAEGDVGDVPHITFTRHLDAAIWAAELEEGDGPGKVYIVEPTARVENAESGHPNPGHPVMELRSQGSLRVVAEVTEWNLYHGTKARLKVGDLITPGYVPNFGNKDRMTTYVYFTRTLDAATWGAELAVGDGPGRIYIVEPTGPIEDDPNVTNKRFRGNPTKSFRSRDPLRVIGEVVDWQGHSPDVVQAMKDGIKRLEQEGVEPMDD